MNQWLEITMSIGCKNVCVFCPQPVLAKAYTSEKRMFTMSDFKTCLETVPTSCQIHGSGFTEPFFNPLCGEMLLYASRKGHAIHLYTTLMGFRPSDVPVLTEIRPYTMIHVPDTTGMLLNDDDWLSKYELYRTSGLPHSLMAMGHLIPKIKKYMENINRAVNIDTMISRGGNLWSAGEKSGKLRCRGDRWHANVLLPSGDVYLCCMDYSLSTKLGNLLQQPYQSIWESGEHFKNNTPSLCRRCEWSEQAS